MYVSCALGALRWFEQGFNAEQYLLSGIIVIYIAICMPPMDRAENNQGWHCHP
jgi:hypothetical protein